jgi:hypothetical protein
MKPNQKQMYEAARNKIASLMRTLVEIQSGPNPLTREQIAIMVKRRPGRYACIAHLADSADEYP